MHRYIPKGVSMELYTPAEVQGFADEINVLPRNCLGYRTPDELFEDFLDSFNKQTIAPLFFFNRSISQCFFVDSLARPARLVVKWFLRIENKPPSVFL